MNLATEVSKLNMLSYMQSLLCGRLSRRTLVVRERAASTFCSLPFGVSSACSRLIAISREHAEDTLVGDYSHQLTVGRAGDY